MSVMHSSAASRGHKLATEENLDDYRSPKKGLKPACWLSILSLHSQSSGDIIISVEVCSGLHKNA